VTGRGKPRGDYKIPAGMAGYLKRPRGLGKDHGVHRDMRGR
jgi:hypothetical protein